MQTRLFIDPLNFGLSKPAAGLETNMGCSKNGTLSVAVSADFCWCNPLLGGTSQI